VYLSWLYYTTDSTIYTSLRGAPSQTDFYTHLHSTVAELVFLFKQCSSFLINTNMTVNVSCESTEVGQLCNSSIHQFSWTHRWYEDNFVSVIRELIDQSTFFYRSNHYISPGCTTVFPFDSQVQQTVYIHLNCVSRGVPLPMLEERMREICEGILLWVSSEA